MTTLSKNLKLEATEKWCNITNNINRKYKTMIDQGDEVKAIIELDKIQNWLITEGLFEGMDFKSL